MKKRTILIVVIILLVLPLIWLSVKYVNLSDKYDNQQGDINRTFVSSLSFAQSAFGSDLNETRAYSEAMSNVASASQLAPLTTYEDKNDSLDVALIDLYKLMEEEKYKKAVVEKSKSFYDYLTKLSLNPLDTEAAESLWKLADEIRKEN